jgi:hypothetical protein
MDGIRYLESSGRGDSIRRSRAQTPICFAPPLRGIVAFAGLALLLLGGVFMILNMETLSLPPRSWWTLALLIPALINLKWIIFGPVLVMLSGVGMLVNTIVPERG